PPVSLKFFVGYDVVRALLDNSFRTFGPPPLRPCRLKDAALRPSPSTGAGAGDLDGSAFPAAGACAGAVLLVVLLDAADQGGALRPTPGSSGHRAERAGLAADRAEKLAPAAHSAGQLCQLTQRGGQRIDRGQVGNA